MGSISLCCKEFIDFFEAFLAIVVVSIDDRKRSIDDVARRKNSLACSPWFCAAFRKGESLRKVVRFLERIVNFILFTGSVFDMLSEDLLKVMLDDKAHSAEARLISIIQAEIHNDIALFRYLVELLVAAVSAAHSGSHNY